MEENKKDKVKFFIKEFLGFILIFFVTNMLGMLISDISMTTGKYGKELMLEIMWLLAVVVVIFKSKKAYIFTETKENFKKARRLGWPIVIIAVINLIVNFTKIYEMTNGYSFINLILYCLAIGMVEEFLCRGYLLNKFLDKYGKDKNGITFSLLSTGAIFGLVHLANAFGTQDLLMTIMQIIQATAIGYLFGAIYYKTRNIWYVAVLHAFYDFSIMIEQVNSIKDYTLGTANASVYIYLIISSLIIIAIYFLAGHSIMNKEDSDKKQKTKKTIKLDTILIIILILVGCLIPKGMINGMDEYMIYYDNYDTKTISYYDVETHFPKSNKYNITYGKADANNKEYNFEFFVNDDNNEIIVKNINTGDELVLYSGGMITSYYVIENGTNYTIVIYDYTAEPALYYSDFISKENMANSKKYLEDIKTSLAPIPVPILVDGGYLTMKNDEYKYPIVETQNNETLIIDKDGKMHLLEYSY